MRHDRYDCGPHCPVAACLDVIGGRWKGSILWLLGQGPARFNVLRRLLGDPPARSLADQLQVLEADGLVLRHVDEAARPPAVTYALTATGERLRPILDAMADWGLRRLVETGAVLPDDRDVRTRARAFAGEDEA